jgi:hypothetical protein
MDITKDVMKDITMDVTNVFIFNPFVICFSSDGEKVFFNPNTLP